MIRYGQVVAVHPERRTVDLVDQESGWRLTEVRTLSANVSSDAGSWDLPEGHPPSNEAAAGGLTSATRQIVAAYIMGQSNRPVVIGFVQPDGGQMVFNEQNRQVHRHASGAYTTIAPDGSIEMFHPGGGYLRIGAGAHQDLAAVAADGNWTLPAGADPPQITLITQGFTVTATPSGGTTDVLVKTNGKMTIQSDGDLAINSGGAVTITGTTIDLNP